jgi:hypothetical protein
MMKLIWNFFGYVKNPNPNKGYYSAILVGSVVKKIAKSLN